MIQGKRIIYVLVTIFIILVYVFFAFATEKRSRKITLVFGGDCAFVNSVEKVVNDNYSYPFANIDLFRQADIGMVNLENPISLRGEKTPKIFNLRMQPKYLNIFKDAHINVVNCANNHIYDYGQEALLDTMNYLDAAGIKHVGAGENLWAARRPVIVQINGMKVGILAYYGDGSWYPAQENIPGTAPRRKKFIQEDINKLRINEKVDFVIVNFHWGQEGSNYPSQSQIDFAHYSIDAGADLIIGHHPHVLQGVEKYKNGIIVYSLGNFLFAGNRKTQYDTAVFKLTLIDNQIIPEIIPVRISSWHANLLTGMDRTLVLEKVSKYSRVFKDPMF
ncbi:MAG: CapA family protein [Syntrophales bacterium]|jgi:poly-gamma-glutamate synthesis protein (capsule biosynthesis protein)